MSEPNEPDIEVQAGSVEDMEVETEETAKEVSPDADPELSAVVSQLAHLSGQDAKELEGKLGENLPTPKKAEEPAEGPVEEEEEVEETEEEQSPPVADGRRSWDARERYKQAEESLRVAREQNARLAQLLQERIGANGSEPQKPATEPAGEEPDRVTQTEEWVAWEVERKLAERLKPLTDRAERERLQEARQQEANQKAAAIQQFSSWMNEAEVEYAASQEGQGYEERIQAAAESVTQGFIHAGYDPQDALFETAKHLAGIAGDASRRGVNPAYALDVYFANIRGQQSNGSTSETPAPAPKKADPADAYERAKAAGGNVAQTVGARGVAPDDVPSVQAAIDRGLSRKDIDKLAKRFDGDPEKAMAAAIQEIERGLYGG